MKQIERKARNAEEMASPVGSRENMTARFEKLPIEKQYRILAAGIKEGCDLPSGRFLRRGSFLSAAFWSHG